MTVTVAIPFHGDRDMLRRCVNSILDQTHTDIRCLVIADGMPAQLHTTDSRVDVYELPDNRGAYFARAVALAATDTEWHAVIDADDWAEPEWLETLLATEAPVTWQQSWWQHRPDRAYVKTMPKAAIEAHSQFVHTTSHIGLYAADALRSVGGWHPGYRVAYDTLLVALLRMTAKFAVVEQPMYHRQVHPSSLTRSPETGKASPLRRQAHVALRRLQRRAFWLRGDVDAIRTLVESTVPIEVASEVEAHADKIRGEVGA